MSMKVDDDVGYDRRMLTYTILDQEDVKKVVFIMEYAILIHKLRTIDGSLLIKERQCTYST
ncbi:hypothetical protein R6Q57_000663 [Mikania cordata]